MKRPQRHQSSAPEEPPSREHVAREDGGRLLVSLHVTPHASRDAIALEGAGLRVRLTAPPVEGAANEAVIALFAARLRLPKRAITLTRGAAARQKTIAVEGISVAEFWERLSL